MRTENDEDELEDQEFQKRDTVFKVEIDKLKRYTIYFISLITVSVISIFLYQLFNKTVKAEEIPVMATDEVFKQIEDLEIQRVKINVQLTKLYTIANKNMV